MKPRLFLSVFTVLAIVVTVGWNARAAFADTPCDSAFVTQLVNVIAVKPTGVDDTANIQCAFDAAVTSGPGVDVRLHPGTFHTGQIVVNDFHGKFAGAGLRGTVVTSLPNLHVTPVDMYLNAPSADNPWPSLFAFVNGDFTIADLAIHISGVNGTTGWTVFGIDPPITELAHAVVILGTEAHARIERFLLEGEVMEDSLFGYNLINGIHYQGFIGELPPSPISGSLLVHDSIFRQVTSGIPVANVSNASVVISHNTFEDVIWGMDGGDFVNSSFEFSHNDVNAIIGFDLYNIFASSSVESTFLTRNNVFRGAIGPALEMTFGEGNECLLLGNNVQSTTDIGIFLGPEIHGCAVVGGSNRTNVLDLGTDNVLVGVNSMGTGIGPDIQPFMKSKK